MSSEKMTAFERRAATSLAAIFALRMLGLFMVFPVFSLYAGELEGATPTLVGLAIGVYGLTQATLQIPFGMASDRLGRKPVIAVGLFVFAAGSVLAALATSIEGVIIGRALQGAGAVAAAVMALTADLTREEHRTKAMAMIGMTIGMSFLVAMVAGPLVGAWFGLSGLFWIIALLALLGIAILYLAVPNPTVSRLHRDAEPVPALFRQVLKDGQLLRIDFGIFVLHMVLTALFVAVPLLLRDAGLAAEKHWQLYLPVMTMAMGAAVPFIIIAEKKRRMKQVILGAIAALMVSLTAMTMGGHSLWVFAGLLWLFFAAFNLLEATMPSLISKQAPLEAKGTAMGVYASSQFIGAFFGGWLGGWSYQHYGFEGLVLLCVSLLVIWWLLAATMQPPRYLATRMLNVGSVDEQKAQTLQDELLGVAGVAEARVIVDDGVAYLKVDSRVVDESALQHFSVTVN